MDGDGAKGKRATMDEVESHCFLSHIVAVVVFQLRGSYYLSFTQNYLVVIVTCQERLCTVFKNSQVNWEKQEQKCFSKNMKYCVDQ